MYKKYVRLLKRGYTIIENENEAKNKKEVTQMRHKYCISSNQRRASYKRCPLISAATLDMYIEISAALSATPLGIHIVIRASF